MDDTQVRSAATDIFSYLVEYNPSMVREFVMQEAQQNDDVSKKLTEQKITNKVNIICTNSKYLYMGSYNCIYLFKIYIVDVWEKCSHNVKWLIPLRLAPVSVLKCVLQQLFINVQLKFVFKFLRSDFLILKLTCCIVLFKSFSQ